MGLYQKLFLYSSAFALLAQCTAQEDELDELSLRHAFQNKHIMQKLHKKMDIDGDGKLSLNDVIEHYKLSFKDIIKRKDNNGDGLLDLKEWGDEDEESKSLFATLDGDGDGKVTAEELHRYESGDDDVHSTFSALFADADTDKDSHLSLDEFLKHLPLLGESDVAFHLEQWIDHLEL